MRNFLGINIKLEFGIPVGSGLGSSAALAHALFKALYDWHELEYTPQILFALVQESERSVHGNPSGVDAAAVIRGGLLRVQKKLPGQGKSSLLDIVAVPTHLSPPLHFYLIQSGVPTETTGEMVRWVAKRLEKNSEAESLLAKLGAVAEEIIDTLPSGRSLSSLLRRNQQLLDELGVVGPAARQMVAELESSGAATKISGAGGRAAGSGMILAYHPDAAVLRQFIEKKGWEYYPLEIG